MFCIDFIYNLCLSFLVKESLRTIELLTKEEFTPIEVIRIATYNGAVALDDQKDIGMIEPGKVDDFVVFDGNISDVIQDN